MEPLLTQTLMQIGINLIYVFLSLFLGVLFIQIIDKRLLPNVNIEHEIQKGNRAVAVFASSVLVFVVIVIAATHVN